MQDIPLKAVPNQRLRLSLGGDEWELTIKAAKNTMCCDVTRNEVILLQGIRVMPDQPLIPYGYLSENGNFAFITENDEYPWWEKFGQSQTLIWWDEDD